MGARGTSGLLQGCAQDWVLSRASKHVYLPKTPPMPLNNAELSSSSRSSLQHWLGHAHIRVVLLT